MNSSSVQIPELSLPKGGGALRGLGEAVSVAGATGVAAFSFPLPISAGRGFAPGLALSYNSGAGNGTCGIGWSLPLASISRDLSEGVPTYEDTDVFLGPGGERLVPEFDPDGKPVDRLAVKHPRFGVSGAHQVRRYWPQVEGGFNRIERWTPEAGGACFWLVQAADGSLHSYGQTARGRIADPQQADSRVAQWLLQASLSVTGELIYYEYVSDVPVDDDVRDCLANRYLKGVRYGNQCCSEKLIDAFEPNRDWHFNVVLDYDSTQSLPKPGAEWDDPVTPRQDAFSRYASGFELRTRRLCRQVRMYHCFDALDPKGGLVLVNRTLLDYTEHAAVSRLTGITTIGLGEHGEDSTPPVTFEYSDFDLAKAVEEHAFTPLASWSGFGHRYQLADLYGEGVAGILSQDDTGWRYRAPCRDHAMGIDGVGYTAWQPLPQAPVGQASEGGNRLLADFSGQGLLDWVITEPGMQGFFSLAPDKTWSNFIPFGAFPMEFFNPQAQMASLVGGAYQDLVLIGPKSVRLYAGQGGQGFAPGRDVEQAPGIALPLVGAEDELVAFSDLLGTGQPQLVRIRHDSVSCWPSLGHGRFGQPVHLVVDCVFDAPARFNPERVFLADVNGNGAADVIYAHADHLAIYQNLSGDRIDSKPVKLKFPKNIQFDHLSQLQFADNRGLGCANLILTLPQRAEEDRHWCFDFTAGIKPYLLTKMDNHQGLTSHLRYRSSAQAWLDDKAANPDAVCHLPFAVHTVASLTHHDAISGNQLTQAYAYHHGYYDRPEREFRGFGLVEHIDSEQRVKSDRVRITESDLAPVVTRTWYHQGIPASGSDRAGYCKDDPQAMALAATLYIGLEGTPLIEQEQDEPAVIALKQVQRRVMAQALAGSVLRTEVTGVPDQAGAVALYTVSEARYRACLLTFHDEDRAVVLPQALESLSYQYDGVPSDPICAQQITLAWDLYGLPLHSVSVHYPRRLTKDDAPPSHHIEEWEKTWWRDSHDPSQQMLRLSESRQGWHHLDNDPNHWRLGLPAMTRTDMLELQVDTLKLEGQPCARAPLLSYERLSNESPENLLWATSRQMTGMQALHYCNAQGEVGEPTLQGLLHHTETAELDALALAAYERVLKPAELVNELEGAGYHRMKWLLTDARDPASDLWGIKADFCEYEQLEGFYRLKHHRLSESIAHYDQQKGCFVREEKKGTQLKYDRYWCQVQTVTNALGHQTHAYYDYRTLQPLQIVDLNGNKQEAVYDGLGRVMVTTFYGTETRYTPNIQGMVESADTEGSSSTVETGFKPLYDSYIERGIRRFVSLYRRSALTLDDAITALAQADSVNAMVAARETVLGGWATAIYPEVDNWMNRCEPTRTATLVADRYPDDPEGQVRVSIAYADGFGRPVQTKVKVEPGKAYLTDNGKLILEDKPSKDAPGPSDKNLAEHETLTRWLVSGRVEYNNKGLPVRNYQPYFLDTYQYVSDTAFRGHAYSSRIDYDPLGRAIKTVRPDGYFQRQTYWPWYVIAEDENDTAEEREISAPLSTVH